MSSRRAGRTSRLRVVDLLGESIAGILQRPSRTALTLLGVVLGIGAFVVVPGVTATAAGQIDARFNELTATQVLVQDLTVGQPLVEGTAFPIDADARVKAIQGVRHGGVYWYCPADRVGSVTGVPLPGVETTDQIPVVAASPGVFGAVRADVRPGRPFDQALDNRGERVAVIGSTIARRLAITRFDIRPVVFIADIPFAVLGVVSAVQRHPELLSAVWIPRQTAENLWPGALDSAQPPQMVIDTALGAAQVVARQAALALRPDAPESFRAVAPPDPMSLREAVSTDLVGLFLVLAGFSLLVGAASIANTTMVAVLERVPEIGLRRALGAQRRHVAAQFLCECTALGTIGGLVSAGLGVTVVVVVAIAKDWSAVVEPWTVLMAPIIGAVTGLVSGLYPAVRASRVEPAEALRQ